MKQLTTVHRFFGSAFLALIILATSIPANCLAKVKTKKITISTDAGAKIFVNGTLMGTSPSDIKVPAYSTVHVRVENTGFITEERNYVNDDSHVIPKTEYIKLEVDLTLMKTPFVADIANHDNDIKTNLKEDDAWKLINRVITNEALT